MASETSATKPTKTVIVTGANSGIGLETTAALAGLGYKVLMACRNVEKATEARKAIVERLKSQHSDVEQRLIVKQVDLASLKSVRAFAQDVLATEERIDVLVNNAGLGGYAQRTLSEDNFEMTMASNHFGHFLLTNLLLPHIKKSAPSRIVVVSSMAHSFVGPIDFENLNSEKSFAKMTVYSVSKLANILFTRHLAKQLEGTGVVVNSLHPGFVDTDLYKMMPSVMQFFMKPVIKLFAKSSVQGAATSIFLASSESPAALVTGRYFVDSKEAQPSAAAQDDAQAKQLWEVSEKLTGLSTSTSTSTP